MAKKETKKSNQSEAKRIAETAIKQSQDLAKKLPMFGHVTWLYTQSPQHKHYFIQDLESRVLPPIVTEQCKIYLRTTTTSLPIAFISWAYLSEEAEARYSTSQRIAPGDWKSGDRLWLIDFLVPFGGSADVMRDLREKIHKDAEVNLLYPDKNGAIGKTTLSELTKTLKPETKKPKTTKPKPGKPIVKH